MARHDFYEDFQIVDYISKPDGLGGVRWDVSEGVVFRAGISTNQSTEAQLAYQTGVRVLYTLVTDKHMELEQGDGVKRLSDGLMLRITSHSRDMQTPAMAEVQYAQVTAEVLTL